MIEDETYLGCEVSSTDGRGEDVGDGVGRTMFGSNTVGVGVGRRVGARDGRRVGSMVGIFDGFSVGVGVGKAVGGIDG